MNKLSPVKNSYQNDALTDTQKKSNRLHKAKMKPFEEPMSPEFRKLYLEEIIKFTEDRINEAKHNLTQSQRYLTDAENAANNLNQKIALISKLKRTPSEKALNLIAFLRDFLPKYQEKMAHNYKQNNLALTITLDLLNDEIKMYRDELDSLK